MWFHLRLVLGSGSKNPTLENLEAMADLYEVSIDYLLGRTAPVMSDSKPISRDMLPVLHGRPIWSNEFGWCVVDNINGCLWSVNGKMPIIGTDTLYLAPDRFTLSPTLSKPISKEDLSSFDEVIVEPISTDKHLKHQLRGYYRVKNNYVENSTGNRFFFDSYGFQWLAFEKLIQ